MKTIKKSTSVFLVWSILEALSGYLAVDLLDDEKYRLAFNNFKSCVIDMLEKDIDGEILDMYMGITFE